MENYLNKDGVYLSSQLAERFGVHTRTIFYNAIKLGIKVKKTGIKQRCYYYTEAEAARIEKELRKSKYHEIKYIDENTAKIILEDVEVIIDVDDIDKIKKNSWAFNGKYIVCSLWQYSKKNYTPLMLHRFIMNAENGSYIDHINGNVLDNRKSNLRFCTPSENSCNKKKYKNNVAGYKGVSPSKSRKKWRADIVKHGVHYFLGYYNTPEEAHEVYCKKAIELHKEFARFA